MSSSSELLSTWASMSLGEQATEDLSSSYSESGSWIIGPPCSSLSSSSRNWSILASSDKREEVVFSFGAATSQGEWWKGSSTSTTSSRARNLGIEMSILRRQGSPALIAWPTSWKLFDNGLKSRMRWTALSCLSLLTNTLDLRTLLRFATLTRLKLGATCLLSAKIAEEQNHGQSDEIHHQQEMKY